MERPHIGRPDEDEYPPGIQLYLDAVEADDLLATLDAQLAEFERLAGLPEEKATFRYESGKWSVKELLVHVADSERVFAYRALRIGRGDDTPMPGFDEKTYAAASVADARPLSHILDELRAIRRSTIALFETFDPETLARRGVANSRVISTRAIGWMIAGHCTHHLGILRERYGV